MKLKFSQLILLIFLSLHSSTKAGVDFEIYIPYESRDLKQAVLKVLKGHQIGEMGRVIFLKENEKCEDFQSQKLLFQLCFDSEKEDFVILSVDPLFKEKYGAVLL